MYIADSKKRYNSDNLRYDTYRTNLSFVNSMKAFLKYNKIESMDCNGFTKKFALAYIEYKEYKCKVSQRTINNHLSFLFTLNKFMIDHELIETNVVADIKTRKIRNQKIRQRIPEETKTEIFEYLKERSKEFYCLSLMTYLCFIRRTEITKLKVKHIDLTSNLICVPAYISKNKNEGFVTIPHQYLKILADHVVYAKPDDFIFSAEQFKPGPKKMNPRKISDFWYRTRKKLDLPDCYQFYSLKDTGITENFEKGIPAIKIRNQARHENITTTELYAPKKQKADDTIKNIRYNL
jgi:integrase